MIIGIGTDIIEISRVEESLHNNRFMNKVYSKQEQNLIKNNVVVAAGNFAGKEAIAKAIGTGFRNFYPREIEILREKSGKPIVNIKGELIQICTDRGIKRIEVSISHCREYAVGYAICY